MITQYNKLVRDKIPNHIKEQGGQPITHIAHDSEYWQKLKEKLLEESHEFLESESLEELADILEVIEAIIQYKGITNHEIQRIRETKAKDRGQFNDRIILELVEKPKE